MTVDADTLNELEAGRYQLVADQWDEILSKPGEPFNYRRHRRGDVVTLDVEQARRLYSAGAVVRPGDLERAQVERARAVYEAALAALPESVRDQVLAGGPTGAEPEPSTPPADTAKVPAKSAGKPDWVAYAIGQGMDPTAAAAANKATLVDTYGTAPTATDGGSLPVRPDAGPASLPLTPGAGPSEPPAGHIGGDPDPAAVVGDQANETGDDEPQAPAKSALKAEWVAFAVTQGWAEEDAEKATVPQLQAELGYGDDQE